MPPMHQSASNHPDETVVMLLMEQYGADLSPAAIRALADAMAPYLARTQLPPKQAVQQIAENYLRDSSRVHELLASTMSPAWQGVLTQVITFAQHHSHFPRDTEATSWPDLDAYSDMQQKLASYNFEGPLDAWITVTLLNRLRRYWRDRQALRAGGPGFQSAEQRARRDATGESPPSRRDQSLELLDATGMLPAEHLVAAQASITADVEAAILRDIVREEIAVLAAQRKDPSLRSIWNASAEQELRLREIAPRLNMTITQIHHRLKVIRAHLQQTAQIQAWLVSYDDLLA